MGRFSRNKGKRGERELALELEKTLGVKARRGVQFQGSPDSPDVITDIPEIHVECKRTERFRLYESLAQAIDDAGDTKIPLVCHRQNQQPWVVVLRLDDLKPLVTTLAKTIRNEPKTDPPTDRSAPDPHGPGDASP